MDQDVIANHDLGCVFQADLFYDSAEIRLTHPHALRVGGDFNQFTGNRQDTSLFSTAPGGRTLLMATPSHSKTDITAARRLSVNH